MNITSTPINPLLAARLARRMESSQPGRPIAHGTPARDRRPVYAKLPLAPVTASPVPELTSLYHNSRAGDYGDRSYPGNCGGNLIRDLLRFYRPMTVLDPMTGSGTCRD